METGIKDIFISYKNDNVGNQLALRLKENLEKDGHKVYLDTHHCHGGDVFPIELRHAIEESTDVILIVSNGCLKQLKENNPIDWIREELVVASEKNKHIIPIRLPDVTPPTKTELPECINFLADYTMIEFKLEDYLTSPYEKLLNSLKSIPGLNNKFLYVSNGNSAYNIKEEFSKTLKEAESGSHKAMYELANLYFFGIGNGETTDRNFEEAYAWFKKLSDCDNEYKAYADSMIGRMYYEGTIKYENQSYEKALEYHNKSAEVLKFGYSAIRAAYMQQEGRGCDFNFEMTENYYKSFIDCGDDTMKMNLAYFYKSYGKYAEAAKIYESVENSLAEAEYNLGMFYKLGVLSDPPKPDYVQALYHFQYALNANPPHPDAANQLGLIYFSPTGNFKKDFKIAQKYFEEGARIGNASSWYMLGYMYEYGYVVQDSLRAIECFEKAAEKGSVNSYHHLAMLYQQDICKNYAKAFNYAKLSAENAVPEGEFILANLLLLGRGCEADEIAAFNYYKRAKKHGMEQAQFMLEKLEKYNWETKSTASKENVFNEKINGHVFISYHNSNRLIADAMVRKLEETGIPCWYAPRDIKGSFAGSIAKAIGESKIVLLLLTKEASESEEVLNEIEIAISRGIHIIPVKLTDDAISDDMQYYIRRMHWIDATMPPMLDRINEVADIVKRFFKI